MPIKSITVDAVTVTTGEECISIREPDSSIIITLYYDEVHSMLEALGILKFNMTLYTAPEIAEEDT